MTGVSDFMPTRVEELLDVLGVRPDPNVTTAVDADEPKEACGDALPAYYEPVYAFDKNAIGQCKKTDAMSVTIKPKPRPDMEKN